jgi:hypothetical protein
MSVAGAWSSMHHLRLVAADNSMQIQATEALKTQQKLRLTAAAKAAGRPQNQRGDTEPPKMTRKQKKENWWQEKEKEWKKPKQRR